MDWLNYSDLLRLMIKNKDYKLSMMRKNQRSKNMFNIHVNISISAYLFKFVVDDTKVKGNRRNKEGLLLMMFTCNVC
jgi:hypothetical protein